MELVLEQKTTTLLEEAEAAVGYLQENPDLYFDMHNWCHCLAGYMGLRMWCDARPVTTEEAKLFFVYGGDDYPCWPEEFQQAYCEARSNEERVEALAQRVRHYRETGD